MKSKFLESHRLSKVKVKKWKEPTLATWLCTIEYFIGRSTSPPRKSGPLKGHGDTDVRHWIQALLGACNESVKARAKNNRYDGNMAIAAKLGLLLVAWFCTVQRAKSFDPNRPLKLRRQAQVRLERYREKLSGVVGSDKLMGQVFGKRQAWNFPYGKGAKGGKFI